MSHASRTKRNANPQKRRMQQRAAHTPVAPRLSSFPLSSVTPLAGVSLPMRCCRSTPLASGTGRSGPATGAGRPSPSRLATRSACPGSRIQVPPLRPAGPSGALSPPRLPGRSPSTRRRGRRAARHACACVYARMIHVVSASVCALSPAALSNFSSRTSPSKHLHGVAGTDVRAEYVALILAVGVNQVVRQRRAALEVVHCGLKQACACV